MQTMRTALVPYQVETLLGVRFWSVQETAKLLLADAQYHKGSKNKVAKVAARIHLFLRRPAGPNPFLQPSLFLKSECKSYWAANHR